MSTSKKLKASDRQTILRKVATVLKKKYGGSIPRHDRNVLETLMFACCLENTTVEKAEAAQAALLQSFFDLNEIRVSSVSEIEHAMGRIDDAAWRALRIRDVLQYVFEKYYDFDFEPLRRKTQDLAHKQLQKIKSLSPFVRQYALQSALSVHVIPIDDATLRVITWLGLVPADMTPEQAAEEIKSSVLKSDVPLLSHLLRSVATDPQYTSSFKLNKSQMVDGALDPSEAPARLEELLTSTKAKSGKKVSRKKPAAGTRTSKTARPRSEVTKKVTRRKQSAPRNAHTKTARKKK